LDQAFRNQDDVRPMGVFHGTVAQTEQFRRETRSRFTWCPDPLGQIHAEWRVDQCPALFAVDATGTIAAVEEPHSAAEIASAVALARQALRRLTE
jgi:hypothetical protein